MKKIITLMMVLSLAFSSVNAVDSDTEEEISDTEDTSVYQPGVASKIIGKAIVVGSIAVVGGVGYYIWKKLPSISETKEIVGYYGLKLMGGLDSHENQISSDTGEAGETVNVDNGVGISSDSNQDLDSGADSPTNSNDTVDTYVKEILNNILDDIVKKDINSQISDDENVEKVDNGVGISPDSNQDLDSGADSPTNSNDTVDTNVSELSEKFDELRIISFEEELKAINAEKHAKWLKQKENIKIGK